MAITIKTKGNENFTTREEVGDPNTFEADIETIGPAWFYIDVRDTPDTLLLPREEVKSVRFEEEDQ